MTGLALALSFAFTAFSLLLFVYALLSWTCGGIGRRWVRWLRRPPVLAVADEVCEGLEGKRGGHGRESEQGINVDVGDWGREMRTRETDSWKRP
jgi:hypothetical protein